ncbi:hypothetical protein LEN26_005808 [Aphanomyces euteiches]|uniref:Uncharacterized protein n=1 Tax=Aphanomyces euteiches TaxID=100861 RepID=A0A6G0WSP5_9STRA|nr:hypothetical protein Ae201684_011933 [Aphanomyces euteiches]KAH9056072.1 hypothetical protein Ae201684P_021811 [Aphanomyces euteiches]KAH9108998.1 hypothetical protein AeMF1_015877 [Aphanomyces euteiches]KAH9137288.1 hypothetical protein LEN26_005808 [Aphanomyces euteiches]KAH9139056.1 hypothetical protein AeRB84_016652 [Aphanomyces euteiches]
MGLPTMATSPATRHKRRRESHLSMSLHQPSDRCTKRVSPKEGLISPTDVLTVGVLTTAFEPTLIQSEAEALTIAAEMSIDFYNEVYVLYNMMSEMRTPNEESRTMDVLMQRLDIHVHDERILAEEESVRNVYLAMLHAYVYLYRVNYRQFAQLDMATHLSICWHRLVAFATEYHVLDAHLLHRSYEFTMQIVRQCQQAPPPKPSDP